MLHYLHVPVFIRILTQEKETFLKSILPIHMKNQAQAILQFTGYPLEPIVALAVNKSLQSRLFLAFSKGLPGSTDPLQKEGFVYTTIDMDERWFSDYE